MPSAQCLFLVRNPQLLFHHDEHALAHGVGQAHLLGVVLTKLKMEGSLAYGYGYEYGYGLKYGDSSGAAAGR